ncbi:S-adenosyl-L-methionine-dependent methyltransferase [Dothidotthia symphoricarpi CBS 119687]|uniref:S-adenosyl-L-methionine-dependent methyltransferase n=1 Tax=Dothidotthia symphoricarpi CBS 119687 TaxID=1392245 RepID=A0A6A6APB8_9PLEO|nr:S-adenosyl-L-methionine-dependent methyltransferase [Dothidotthia symphoricarpi CBS 119687]KAF2133033.1 S-adenosyl-L-methionine-dependent methyltransferase [Dothidotthia symphoricarpi CBS 119687]
MTSPAQKKDWSAAQYLKFGNERTRPVHDLLRRVTPHLSTPTPRIYDLGCGPGNSTQVLLDAFPGARATGIDSSADMLRQAREDARLTAAGAEFEAGDVGTWRAPAGQKVDLLFSNAVFHWLRSGARIPALAKLFKELQSGAVLAIQVPDNYDAPSHTLMRTTALLPGKPWSSHFVDAQVGNLEDQARPDLDPIERPEAFYDALAPLAASVDIWRTEYYHVLSDAGAIVEWVKGTGLQPYLQRMGDDEGAKTAFLSEYEERLKGEYKELVDGKVLLGYPRLFLVAVRK